MLQGVLGLLAAAEHLSAEGEQAAVVAVVDDLERGVVTGAHPRHEAIVAHAAAAAAHALGLGNGRERAVAAIRPSMRHPRKEM